MKRTLADLREEMRAVARGERKAAPLPAGAVLSALASQGNLDLLKLISRGPDSVGQLAEWAQRAPSNVSRSLQILAKHGFIRLEREGKEVRPVAVVEKIGIDLVDGTYSLVGKAA